MLQVAEMKKKASFIVPWQELSWASHLGVYGAGLGNDTSSWFNDTSEVFGPWSLTHQAIELGMLKFGHRKTPQNMGGGTLIQLETPVVL